ncbi:YsnF/AvaK domain-containing protein [Paenibacillus sp. YPG26]|uniref:YsnF/AvaK domain-containing protein n=1 Tax=Paenibacillus sp. YPG26 TaxID=2878915 RepID=UPI00203A6979|nr:YsnF/AvaK domain-containing protein [Paenibacillus sp. YPG26]USB33735.1 YsnF/AvaK domain-containing protein [Paenibacillus sp. YPG26]
MTKKIVGVFRNDNEATNAIEELKRQGFKAEDISIVAKDKRDVSAISDETGTKAPEGVATGAATGGILGGVTGLLAGLGALAIPGIGPIVAAGPIAAALTGAAVGAGAGGLVGGLVGLGIPEEEAKEYDTMVNDGRILVIVDADSAQEGRIYQIFRDNNSLNAHYYNKYQDSSNVQTQDVVGTHLSAADTGTKPVYNEVDNAAISSGTGRSSAERESDKLRLHEEQLTVDKNRVQTGEVQIHKEIVEEQKTINVPVTHEEVVIERRAVHDGDSVTGQPIGKDETIRIPVSEEKVEVNKQSVVTGEIEARKREVQETEQVQDVIRKEEARVERSGSPEVREEQLNNRR